jgi:hypothetical protein
MVSCMGLAQPIWGLATESMIHTCYMYIFACNQVAATTVCNSTTIYIILVFCYLYAYQFCIVMFMNTSNALLKKDLAVRSLLVAHHASGGAPMQWRARKRCATNPVSSGNQATQAALLISAWSTSSPAYQWRTTGKSGPFLKMVKICSPLAVAHHC